MYSKIKVSVGEMIDKYTILMIKRHNMPSNKDVEREYRYLKRKVESLKLPSVTYTKVWDLLGDLHLCNSEIWVMEDSIRLLEAEQVFDDEFVGYARGIYCLNDERFRIKNEINTLTESTFREQKHLPQYRK